MRVNRDKVSARRQRADEEVVRTGGVDRDAAKRAVGGQKRKKSGKKAAKKRRPAKKAKKAKKAAKKKSKGKGKKRR